MTTKIRFDKRILGGALFFFGLLLASGAAAVPLSALPGPAFANGQVALILNGNQCNSTAGSQPTSCPTGCYFYSCASLPTATPGVIQGTTDANGHVSLVVASYTTGSSCGYLPNQGFTCGVTTYPFYQTAVFIDGKWQLQCCQFQPGNSPSEFQIAVNDTVTGLTYWADVTVCYVSCTSPPSTTVSSSTYGTTTITSTVSYTTILSGTATTVTTVTTVTEPLVQTTTETVNGQTTTETVISTVSGAPVTSTITTGPTTTVTSATTQTVTSYGTTSSVVTSPVSNQKAATIQASQVVGVVLILFSIPLVRSKKPKSE